MAMGARAYGALRSMVDAGMPTSKQTTLIFQSGQASGRILSLTNPTMAKTFSSGLKGELLHNQRCIGSHILFRHGSALYNTAAEAVGQNEVPTPPESNISVPPPPPPRPRPSVPEYSRRMNMQRQKFQPIDIDSEAWKKVLESTGTGLGIRLDLCVKKCIESKNYYEGKRVHAQINKSGSGFGKLLGNLLVQMYTDIGAVDDALPVFDRIWGRNVELWDLMISGYILMGRESDARKLFELVKNTEECKTAAVAMQQCGLEVDVDISKMPQRAWF